MCDGLRELAREVEAGAGVVLLTEEALAAPGIDELLATLANQPAWSDLPVVLLMQGGILSPAATQVLQLAPQRNSFGASGADAFRR